MNLSKPFAALSPSVDLEVLIVLANSTVLRSGRELARRTGRSNTGVQHVLNRLVDEGLVDRQEAGRAFLYTLNHDHLLAPAVHEIARPRSQLVHRLRELLGHWEKPPVHASLFGSAARGDGDASSDIDVLIVRPDDLDVDDEEWRGALEHLAERICRWTGNHAGVVEISEVELPSLRRRHPAVVDEVRADAIDLIGEPARRLLANV